MDHWIMLGFAMYDGPDPSETLIGARARTANYLCGLAAQSTWTEADRAKANDTADKARSAAVRCEKELKDVLRERRKLKCGKLPLWKELGADALEFLKSSAPSRVELPITQWSKILNPGSLSHIKLVHVRELANLAEKGDEKIWDRLQGKDVLLWAPSDNNALARILAALLRRAGSDRRPTALRMIAPVPLLAGMNTAESITDLWWHPLLSEKWVPLVRGCSFSAYPF